MDMCKHLFKINYMSNVKLYEAKISTKKEYILSCTFFVNY